MELLKPRLILAGLVLMLGAGCAPEPLSTLPDEPTQENTPIADNGNLETPLPEEPAPPVVKNPVEDAPVSYFAVPAYSEAQKTEVLKQYGHLDPNKAINTKLLENAVLYFHKNKHLIKNQNVMTVIDFAKRSSQTRFFVITMKTGSVWAIRTAHGKGSDANHDGYAEKFSNVPNSNASSLGAYIAAETYYGSHDLSLRLDGKSTTNSKARERAVVIHGADYVQEANVIQGRSWGCPAVSMPNRDKVVNTLKGGSLVFAGLGS